MAGYPLTRMNLGWLLAIGACFMGQTAQAQKGVVVDKVTGRRPRPFALGRFLTR